MKVLSVRGFIACNDKYVYLMSLKPLLGDDLAKQFDARLRDLDEFAVVQFYSHFLSNEFKPELVEKYFKGFLFLEDHAEVYSYEQITASYKYIISIFSGEYCLHYLAADKLGKLECFQNLRNFHDFINDCERKGIYMEWNV